MSIQKNKGKMQGSSSLPEIPPKLYFTIGEVGGLCSLKPHVLRYWEQEFTQLRPTKRRGNRRYYQREDVELVRKIRELLYFQGYTIEGARQQLSSLRRRSAAKVDTADAASALAASNTELTAVVSDLELVLDELEEV